ncbi:MAG: ATP-binding protein [Anaerolineales bacterium]|jgi:signal transduction histidine kinase
MATAPRVLVVDDEQGIRQGCERVLKPLGYEVDQAGTIQEGRNRVESGAFDLVLIDVMLPDGRGIELLEPILARDPDTICIIITGYATVELAVQAIKQGAYDFLAKPFDADVLELAVSQGLEKRRLALEAKRLQAVEHQLDEAEREKDELNRLNQFKTNFMWMMAHELRSPLSATQSLVRTLLKGLAGPLTEKQHELISRVDLRLENLQSLVNDLLELAASKKPDVDLSSDRIDLAELLENVVNGLSPTASQKDVQLKYTRPASKVLIQSNADGLQTVVSNLLDNAIKYTPADGRVTINVYTQDDCVEMRIADTGIGIPPEEISHLGEEFFRAPNARHSGLPGTGLGLSIVKQILDRVGGRMDVESKLGKGTTVTVWIPEHMEATRPN